MHEGTIFDVGTPKEVITEENLRTVYNVVCKVIDDDGSPHVILKDSIKEPKVEKTVSGESISRVPDDDSVMDCSN